MFALIKPQASKFPPYCSRNHTAFSPNKMACLTLAICLSLVNIHALAGGGKSGGSASIAAGGGTDVLSGAGGAGTSGGTYGGGGGGAGTTGGQGGTGSGGAGIAGAGGTFAAGGNGNGGNGGFSGDGGGGGGGGAHGFVGTALPISAKTGGYGGNGGGGSLTGGGGGAGGYGAVITSTISGSITHIIKGGTGGTGGTGGAMYGGDGGSGGHGLVLQHGGTLSINSRISGGAGGEGGRRGNGGDGGNGIHVHTAGSSLNLTLKNGADIQAGNGGAAGTGGGTAGTAGAAIRFNSGSNSLTLHDTVQIHGNLVANGSNDTLNVRGKDISITAGNIQGFETLHFYVQSDTPANATLLNLTESTDISSSTIGVGLEGSNTLLNEGDSINLITTSGTLTTPTTLNNNTTGMSGISTLYDFTLQANSQTLTATVTKVGINPQVKSLSEARLAGIELVNRGGDLAANTGLENLVKATQNGGIQGFSAIGGGKTRTETGSHIDVKGGGLLFGAGTSFIYSTGKLSIGAYAEYGKGSYDSYNDFANRPDVHASGDTEYYGVGLLAKQQFNKQWFVDGGLRLGKSSMDYYSSDLVDAAGNSTRFSGTLSYRGVNIGVGKDIELNENNRLTPYVKLAYTHSSGDSQTIAGSTFDFSAMNSLRSRLGARWTHQFNETSQFYTDAAWEHESQGKAKGEVLDFAMPEPSLQGDTGVVNVGVNFRPHENLTVGVGVQGEFGKRNGISATTKVKYSF